MTNKHLALAIALTITCSGTGMTSGNNMPEDVDKNIRYSSATPEMDTEKAAEQAKKTRIGFPTDSNIVFKILSMVPYDPKFEIERKPLAIEEYALSKGYYKEILGDETTFKMQNSHAMRGRDQWNPIYVCAAPI